MKEHATHRTERTGPEPRRSGAPSAGHKGPLRRKIVAALAALVMLAAVMLASCGEAGRTLRMSGATTLTPVFTELGEALRRADPTLRVTVTGGGSTKGVLDVVAGSVDVGGAARESKANEASLARFEPVALDALAVVAHADLGLADVDAETLRALYTGENVPGFEGVPLIGKAPAHGTHQAFKAALGLEDAQLVATAEAGSNGELIAYVLASCGIGYVSLADAEAATAAGEPLAILSVEGVRPSAETLLSGGYPLSRTLYFVLPKASMVAEGRVSRTAEALLALVRSDEGRAIIVRAGFLPIR